MTKNPIINGLSASIYIILVALVMNFIGKNASGINQSLLVPVAVISLFTLSAAIMGFLFGYQPGQLYFDKQKKEAVKLFLQTVAVFGAITVLVFILLLSGLFFK